MTDTMHIWDRVSKTNPANTKKVNQRGGFTSICAHSQIMEATRVFGPIGQGWGYTAGQPIFHDTLVLVPVTLWHGSRESVFGPVYGCEEWKSSKGHIDSDAPKKAGTDGLTKLLSQLGFNADVFLGKFDDHKYIAEMKREFSPQADPQELPTGPINDETRDWLSSKIETTGKPVGEFCKAFGVTTLKAITYEQMADAKAWVRENRKAA